MANNKFYFVHDFDPQHDYADGTIISLYPDVSYQLAKRGISYFTPTDYYSEREMFNQRNKHFSGYIDWVISFDDFLKNNISFCKKHSLEVGRINLSVFKALFDELYMETFAVKHFLSSLSGQTEIIYIRKRSQKRDIKCPQTFLAIEKNNFVYDILKKYGEQYNVSKIILFEVGCEGEQFSTKDTECFLKKFMKHHCYAMFRWIKSGIKYFEYQKWRSIFKKRGGIRKYMILHRGTGHIDPVIKGLLIRREKVYMLDGDNVYDCNGMGEKKVVKVGYNNNLDFYRKVYEECSKADEKLQKESAIFDFIDNYSGLQGAREIIRPFLTFFVKEKIPILLAVADNFRNFFNDQKITNILATNSADIYAKAALIAANATECMMTKSCFQHGMHGYFDRIIFMTDIDPFDQYFVNDPISKDICVEASKIEYVKKANIVVAPHYLNEIRRKYQRKITGRRRKKFLYIPTKVVSYKRNLTVPTYSVTWYFEYQKQLMDLFLSMKEYRFIYKQAKSSRKMPYLSILAYLKDWKKSNVFVETGKIMEYFKEVDGVIIDRPTTSTFEVAVSGLPFICLCANSATKSLYDGYKEAFKRSFKEFSTIQETLQIVKNFVEFPEEGYATNLRTGDFDFCDIHEKLKSPINSREGVV